MGHPTLVGAPTIHGNLYYRLVSLGRCCQRQVYGMQTSHLFESEYLMILISDRMTSSEHVFHSHVFLRSAHTLLARACLSVLLRFDDRVNEDNI